MFRRPCHRDRKRRRFAPERLRQQGRSGFAADQAGETANRSGTAERYIVEAGHVALIGSPALR